MHLRWPWQARPGDGRDELARKRAHRRLRLSILGMCILVWVSKGSYDTTIWSLNYDPTSWLAKWAVLYPVIVDAGVVLVMPYTNDSTLPEAIRRHATKTTWFAFGAIIGFNALHTFLAALGPDVHIWAWVKPVVALIAGAVPVVLYMRVMSLDTMVGSWELRKAEDDRQQVLDDAARVRRETAEQAERERLADIEAQREADRAARAHEAEMERIRVQTEADARMTQAKAAAAATKQAAGQTRGASAGHPAGNGAGPARGNTPEIVEDPQVAALIADLPPGGKGARVKVLMTRAWDEGIDLTPTDAGKAISYDPRTARKLAQELRAEGIVPPSERPRLALAAAEG